MYNYNKINNFNNNINNTNNYFHPLMNKTFTQNFNQNPNNIIKVNKLMDNNKLRKNANMPLDLRGKWEIHTPFHPICMSKAR
jgi:hypothetical protein